MPADASGHLIPRRVDSWSGPEPIGAAHLRRALPGRPLRWLVAPLLLALAFSLTATLGGPVRSQPAPILEQPRLFSVHPTVASSSTVQTPAAIASSWSASPVLVPPLPAPPQERAAGQLARQAQQRFGVTIALEGQDWGPDEESQLTNIEAVISAMERMPAHVASAVAAHPHGPLTFLSNQQGRTLGGWQPYGDFPIGFYTNSDKPALSEAGGPVPANQIVLIPGFADTSIGHEIMHAYQLRDVGPEQYALAMLGEEMRSFARATGWRQVGTDKEVRATLAQPWDALNALFVYEGRPLTYTSAPGQTATLNPPNPIEAFAVAGSFYYTRPSWLPLPDWPEYWAWFQTNIG